MDGAARETIVIVHGTWAAPESGKSQWYQPVIGIPESQSFTAKLNAALQERGSPARCWAHCSQGNEIFQWSGENSWIARTLAASALADYVAKLRKDGWQCHIVAHSHGGNVVVEALPNILTVSRDNGSLRTVIAMGTPFMNTMSPILHRMKRLAQILNVASWIALVGLIFLPISFMIYDFYPRQAPKYITVAVALVLMLVIAIIALFHIHRNYRRMHSDSLNINGVAEIQPCLLAIGSPMDEAWQLLHHMRNIGNPLAVRSSLF